MILFLPRSISHQFTEKFSATLFYFGLFCIGRHTLPSYMPEFSSTLLQFVIQYEFLNLYFQPHFHKGMGWWREQCGFIGEFQKVKIPLQFWSITQLLYQANPVTGFVDLPAWPMVPSMVWPSCWLSGPTSLWVSSLLCLWCHPWVYWGGGLWVWK